MRVALLSSTEFGRRCAKEALLEAEGVDLVGILTTPEQIRISYAPEGVAIAQHADFSDLAERAGCALHALTAPVNAERYREALAPLHPDLLLALGWYYNIPRTVRDLAPSGCIGIHASLLPKFRGGAPIPWAIIEGERETGVTLFYFEDEVDAGDIIAQAAFPIDAEDTSASVYEKAADAAIDLLRNYLPRLAVGDAPRTPQDPRHATIYPQRKPEDGRIDWSWPAQRVQDFIRAQTRPYPGAFTEIEGKRVTIYDAKVEPMSEVDHTASATRGAGGEAPLVAVTLDIDWAPDFMIDQIAEQLVGRAMPATWFITHASDAVDRLRERPDMFELAIHPNLLPGSTHGEEVEPVLEHCMAMVPEARAVRTHGLVQSTAFLGSLLATTPVRTDVSIFMPHARAVAPVEHWWRGEGLLRLPYVWEDEFEMERPSPCWDADQILATQRSFTILDFHPVHVHLNSRTMDAYERLKGRSPRLSDARPADVRGLRQQGEGTGACFDQFVAAASTGRLNALTVQELTKRVTARSSQT